MIQKGSTFLFLSRALYFFLAFWEIIFFVELYFFLALKRGVDSCDALNTKLIANMEKYVFSKMVRFTSCPNQILWHLLKIPLV
jgi:hypothetical protein